MYGRLIVYLTSLIAAIPAAILGFLISRYWVNVPLFDEWDTPGRLLKEVLVEDRLSWASLFAQHNESRMVLPKLVWLGCAALWGWDTKIGQAITWVAAVATWACWAVLVQRHTNYSLPRRFVLLLLMALIFFSTNQWENWLWAFQLTVFVPGLCLSACLVIHHGSLSYNRKIFLCAVLALISTYSNANGMLCWLLGWPFPQRYSDNVADDASDRRAAAIRATAVYAIVMTLSIGGYFYGYRTPPNHPAAAFAFTHPRDALHHLLAWIGNPLARGVGVTPLRTATIAGTITFIIFALVCLFVWRRRSALWGERRWQQFYPWLAVTLYGLASGCITTVGRVGFGVEQAIATRYITFACYVFVGLIGMIAYALEDLGRSSSTKSTLAEVAEFTIACTFIFFVVADWKQSLPSFPSHWRTEEQLRLTLRFLPLIPDDPLLPGLYPNPAMLKEVALPLLTYRVLRQQPVGSWLTPKLQVPDGDDAGAFAVTKTASATTTIRGHSVVSANRPRPDCIVLASIENNIPRLVTAIDLPKRGDIRASDGHLDFAVNLPASAVPPLKNLRAYSVDLAHRQVLVLTPVRTSGLLRLPHIEDQPLLQCDRTETGNLVLGATGIDAQNVLYAETIQ
jgi:hypothetical protein